MKTLRAKDLKNLQIIRLNTDNFNEHSLDEFVLKQRVKKCWRKINGEYKLVPVAYTEEWNLSDRKNMAKKIVAELKCGAKAFAAVAENFVIGFALLSKRAFGSGNRYVDLEEFYVSEPFRRRGIGKILFEKTCLEARKSGAEKLYISAHSAEESIAAYTKYGCVAAEEPDKAHIDKEPMDLQLEYDLLPHIFKATNKETYMDLLLLADEQRDMVERYLPDGIMFVLDDCGVKGEITVSDTGDVLEIKNLAVFPEFRRKGYGKQLVEYVCALYKNKFPVIIVGTGDSPMTVPFYEKCGFVKSHYLKNFFTDNYDHPIYEGGVLLKDMLYLKKKL